MKLVKTTIADWFSNIPSYLQNEEEVFGYSIQEQTEVTYGFDNDCNIDWCEEHNIPVYNLGCDGGCIVHTKDNIGLGFVYSITKYQDFLLSHKFLPAILDYLLSKGFNATLEHNDIMIDGYKVASCGEYQFDVQNGWGYGILHISMNQDLYVIEHACKKPMVKVPKGLSEFGITQQEMLDLIFQIAETL